MKARCHYQLYSWKTMLKQILIFIVATAVLLWAASSHNEKSQLRVKSYQYNVRTNATLSFETCDGLVNQRIAILHGLLIGYITNRTVVLPTLNSQFSNTLSFRDIYNELVLIDAVSSFMRIHSSNMSSTSYSTSFVDSQVTMKSHNQRLSIDEWIRKSNEHDSQHLKLDCTLNAIAISNDLISVLWQLDSALVFADHIQSQAQQIINQMPRGYTALHYRTDQDWIDHCQKWESTVTRNNCFTNTNVIGNVFALEKVPTDRPVYVAGGFTQDSINSSLLRQLLTDYKLITKDLSDNIVSHRDVHVAIDYIICTQAELFIGNSVSTFSASIELRRLQFNLPVFHYNGGNIPLQEYLPVHKRISLEKPLKWVFTVYLTTTSNMEHIRMAKVAIFSVKKQTLLTPVCLMMIDDLSRSHHAVTEFVSWLQAQEVIVLQHTPVWSHVIFDLHEKGLFIQNLRYSPLYNNSNAMMSTFLRLDIPIVGFIDEYVLYTDLDVMFVRHIQLHEFGPNMPTYVTMGTENLSRKKIKRRFDLNYGNAGVILYNIPNMHDTYNKFMDWTFSEDNKRKGLRYGVYGPGDQGAYNSFYRNQFKATIHPNAFFNWRPYYKGTPLDLHPVGIVHWHGPKPEDFMNYYQSPDQVLTLYHGLLSNCDRSDAGDDCWQWNRLWFKFYDQIEDTSIKAF